MTYWYITQRHEKDRHQTENLSGTALSVLLMRKLVVPFEADASILQPSLKQVLNSIITGSYPSMAMLFQINAAHAHTFIYKKTMQTSHRKIGEVKRK